MKQQCAGYYNIASSPDEASRIHNNSFMYNGDGSIKELERESYYGFLFPAEGLGEEDEPIRHSVIPNSSSEMGLTSLVTKMANYHLQQTTVLSSDVGRQLLLTLRASILGMISIIMHRWPVRAKEGAPGIWGRNSLLRNHNNIIIICKVTVQDD